MERAQSELEAKKFKSVADTCKEGVKLAQAAAADVIELGLRKQRVGRPRAPKSWCRQRSCRRHRI